MSINRVGSGSTPGQVQDAGSVSRTSSPEPVPAGDLRPHGQKSSVARRIRMPPGASQQISAQVNEVRGLLDAGGGAMLQQGVQDGFESLPAEYRGIAMQT